ncbi:MAG TPA: hypothetical protein VFE24_09740 [Pirellulales bacterium]|jgi:hypothetical protein|nr:hypothetical protein [Pirellulales bacterium]
MMLGTQQRFGIECYIINCQGGFIIGDLWLWADGMRIGDEISGVDLPLILSCLSGPLRLGDSRHDVFFDQLSKEQVADFFYKLLFTEEEFADEVATMGFLFRRYLVISAPDLEGFDSVFLLLLGLSDGRDRLIWKYKGTEAVHEMLLDPGEYDGCVLSCFDWLEKQTGYRSQQRTWLGLGEPQRKELRKAILARRPQLGEPGLRESLDQATIEELNRKKL